MFIKIQSINMLLTNAFFLFIAKGIILSDFKKTSEASPDKWISIRQGDLPENQSVHLLMGNEIIQHMGL